VCGLARPEKDRSSWGTTEQFPSVLPIVFVVIILSCLDGVLVETSSLTAGRSRPLSFLAIALIRSDL